MFKFPKLTKILIQFIRNIIAFTKKLNQEESIERTIIPLLFNNFLSRRGGKCLQSHLQTSPPNLGQLLKTFSPKLPFEWNPKFQSTWTTPSERKGNTPEKGIERI